jgi:hypothetical protein
MPDAIVARVPIEASRPSAFGDLAGGRDFEIGSVR